MWGCSLSRGSTGAKATNAVKCEKKKGVQGDGQIKKLEGKQNLRWDPKERQT